MISMRFSSTARAVTVVCVVCAGLFSVFGREVSSSEAGLAVGAWARSGRTLRDGAAVTVASVSTHAVTNGVSFHAVKLSNGGTVFTTADSDLEPVIAFTSSTNDFSTMDRDGTLWALLSRDVQVRSAYAKLATKPVLSTASASARAAAAEPTAPVAVTASANAKWASLLALAKDAPRMSALAALSPATGAHPNNFKTLPADLRVPQIVKSQWSQQTAPGGYCYNYHTPDHDPCGCTATAAAQIMRYWELPKTDIGQVTRSCTVNGIKRDLTTVGGVYDWSLMTLVPGSQGTNPEVNREMIGRLCYDVGVLINSAYTASGTSSVLYRVPRMLLENAGFANAVAYYDTDAWDKIRDDGKGTTGGLHVAAMREKTILASLDAGAPVELGIYGFPAGHIGNFSYWCGHAVVGDGYGYATYDGEAVPYVHINLGWAGQDDAWYNLPEINCASTGAYAGSDGTDFTVMGMVMYNVFPDRTGQVLSGRVYDADEEGIAGATVTLYNAGTDEIVATTNTSASGVYAFVVPGDKSYDVKAKYEELKGELDTGKVFLKADAPTAGSDGCKYVQSQSGVGNSWGNDIELSEPSVRIEGGESYTSLHRALAAAQPGDTITVFANTRMKGSVTVGASCRIVAEGSPVVRCATGASLAVSAGAEVSIEGLVFSNVLARLTVAGDLNVSDTEFEAVGPVSVEADGVLTVARASFGAIGAVAAAPGSVLSFEGTYVEKIGAVVTEGSLTYAADCVFGGSPAHEVKAGGSYAVSGTAFADGGVVVTVRAGAAMTLGGGVAGIAKIVRDEGGEDGFTLAGALTEPIDVECAAASARSEVFGGWTCDYPTAAGSASFLANALDADGDLGGKAISADGTLVWEPISWTRELAVCYTAVGGVTNYYRKLNSLLKYNHDAGETVEAIVYADRDGALILKDAFTLKGDLRLRAETDSFVVRMTDAASFTIGSGSALTVTDLTFDGAGETFAKSFVNIAGGAFAMKGGAVITNAVFDYCSGAVELCGGGMTMESGAAIAECHIDPVDWEQDRHGGAVNVYEGVFSMRGGRIVDCSVDATSCGGGVYVMSYAYDAVMEVSGDAVVTDCTSGTGSDVRADNVNWQTDYAGTCGLVLAGPFTGDVGVSAFDADSAPMATTNDCFAAVAENVRDDSRLPEYAARFVNDADAQGFVGTNAADLATLVWIGRVFTYKRDPSDPDIVVRVIPEAGGVTNYYADLGEAFAEIDGPSVVELVNPYDYPDYEVAMTNSIVVAYPVVLRCGPGVAPTVFNRWNEEMGAEYYLGPFHRYDDVAFEVTSSLVLTNIYLDGGGWEYAGPSYGWQYNEQGNLINVNGGSLTMQAGAGLGYTVSHDNRAANGVTVKNGVLRMEPGSWIRGCGNYYRSESGEGKGGGILAEHSTVYLDGAVVTDCVAGDGGGVYLANETTAYISGATRVKGNHRGYYDVELDDAGECPFITEEAENNIVLDDHCTTLCLEGALADKVGVTHGYALNETNVFGRVTGADLEALSYSATNFVNDVTGACGTVLTNGASQAILVWWNAACTNADGLVEFDWAPEGEEPAHYVEVVKNAPPEGPDPVAPDPIAFEAISKNADGSWTLVLTNTVTGCKYRILGTDDLAKGFSETVKDWTTAEMDGPWTNKVDGVGAKRFWKAEAKGNLE